MIANRQLQKGYVLFEVLIAITVFAVSFAGLIKALGMTIEVSNQIAFNRHLRYGLESILTEARHRDVEDMAMEYVDEALGVVYRTTVEELQFSNSDGEALSDLYSLTATVTYETDANEILRSAEVWVYENQENNR
ncbi:MAG: hypothetical protein AAF585_00465 [Verrucomicrobiota bacterium]